ncbi:pre-toxin TG domain-containing protein [Nitrincola sp. MINF-07-Sa-05]|uniref:pre-toxin TG domain-containing protein n=1 Tax=Nitrincola salilacus TaxID=3400273 RepID=UPI003917DB6C
MDVLTAPETAEASGFEPGIVLAAETAPEIAGTPVKSFVAAEGGGAEGSGFGIRDAASIGVGALPVAGSVQSVVELISGKDYITGEETSRAMAAVGILAGLIPFGKGALKAGSKWFGSRKAAEAGVGVVRDITPNAQQAANVKRFIKKIPSNSKDNVQLRELPNGGVAVQAESPGKVLGSKAVYEKQIDVDGKTIQATKTTYDPQGNIVHVKDKLNGGTYP